MVMARIAISFIPPMECLPVERLPEGEDWVYELKLDGYRSEGIRDANSVRILSKNGNDVSKKYPRLIAALERSLMEQTVVDGELVAFDGEGRPSFNEMQNAGPETNVVFFVFDLLVDQGRDVKHLPLSDRRRLLEAKVIFSDLVQRSEHFSGSLSNFVAGVQKIGGEGVVAKRLNSPYEPGKRSGSWRKKRITIGQEFVIGGFTVGSNGLDAVIVGYYEGKSLIYSARVRAGFVPATRQRVRGLLEPLITSVCPFKNLPEATAGRWGQGLTAAKMKDCVWVKPKLVANFEFLEWTGTNHVRHIKFVGIRNDKDPRKVVREC
jgi:DNA ligase D-like protein (predicted ligase)